MIRIALFFCLTVWCVHADVFTTHLDGVTALNDGTTFTSGVTYYSAFQLTGGMVSSTTAEAMNFNLGGGIPDAPSSGDPTSGIFAVAPDAALGAGIFQPSGTLTLMITPATGYSLYTQKFTAGSSSTSPLS